MIAACQKQRALLSVIITLFFFAQYVYVPYQTPFLTLQGVSSSFVGLVVGAYGVSQMLARLPVGVLADSVNRHRTFITLGMSCAGIASLIRFLVPTGMGFFAANLLSGFASAMWISFLVLYTSFYEKEEQQAGTSHAILFNNAGILLGFVLATLLYAHTSMRVLCLMSCSAGLLGAVLARFLKKPVPSLAPHPPVGELLAVCKGKRLLLFSALALLQQGLQMSTTMSFTTQVFKNLGASAAVIGASSVLYMISAVASSLFAASKCCARRGARFWIPCTFLLMTGYCLLVPLASAVWMLVPLQLLPGMSTGILFSYLTSEAMAGVPAAKKSTAMGCYQAIYAIGMTFFPVLTGKVVDLSSMTAAYFTLALLAAAGALAALWYYRKERAHV